MVGVSTTSFFIANFSFAFLSISAINCCAGVNFGHICSGDNHISCFSISINPSIVTSSSTDLFSYFVLMYFTTSSYFVTSSFLRLNSFLIVFLFFHINISKRFNISRHVLLGIILNSLRPVPLYSCQSQHFILGVYPYSVPSQEIITIFSIPHIVSQMVYGIEAPAERSKHKHPPPNWRHTPYPSHSFVLCLYIRTLCVLYLCFVPCVLCVRVPRRALGACVCVYECFH